jgi:ATP-dependent DNA helicase DinG
VDGLTAHVKRKISVPTRCFDDCRYRASCHYLRFRNSAGSSAIDIQVCNHNYLLADTLRRADGQRSLIPNYQALIIDEAHKFLSVARSMYGTQLEDSSLPDTLKAVAGLNFELDKAQRYARRTAKLLSDQSKRLFHTLIDSVWSDEGDTDDDAERLPVSIDSDASRYLRNIHDISNRLLEFIKSETIVGCGADLKPQVLWDLERVRDQAATLVNHGELICWLETDSKENRLCAIPQDLNKRLFADLWSNGVPTVLASGTLSAGGDFSHTKLSFGLDLLRNRLTETSKPSPFNYSENTLLYISENVPFPDQRDIHYIDAVSDEIERLVKATRGHAAVLFTSYKAMDMVWERLSQRELPFKMFRLDKGGISAIERFKQSGNGILFASGALWEGIDIPGDTLSLLIIVRLPFAVPDPVGEHERAKYKEINIYKKRIIIPEMLIKLKQGFGRLIRNETDTGVVAILDCRAGINGAYRSWVLHALPNCRVTAEIVDVGQFIEMKKSPSYFAQCA